MKNNEMKLIKNIIDINFLGEENVYKEIFLTALYQRNFAQLYRLFLQNNTNNQFDEALEILQMYIKGDTEPDENKIINIKFTKNATL